MKTKQHSSKNLLDSIYLFCSVLFAGNKSSKVKKVSPAHISRPGPQYRPESKYLGETESSNKNRYPGTYAFMHRYR